MFAFVSAPRLTLLMSHRPHRALACSMRHNNLTNYGQDMSGLLKLVQILPETKIESLGCAAAPRSFPFVSAPTDKKANTLCGPSL